MTRKVAVLVGSLRKASLNLKLARALEGLAAGSLAFDLLPLGDLPLYNDELWTDLPPAVADFKARLDSSDAVLVVTPEYNRCVPGLLANAFDWGSRPTGKSSWLGKPVAICGATPGATGTAAAQQHARLMAVNLGMIPMTFPELYVTWTAERFGEDGQVKSDDTRALLQSYADAFAKFVEKHC